jgi:hypothetical protein
MKHTHTSKPIIIMKRFKYLKYLMKMLWVLAKACAKYNRVMHLVEELRQRYQLKLDEALLYQKNVLEAEKSLFQIRSEVNYTTSLARNHSNIHCSE